MAPLCLPLLARASASPSATSCGAVFALVLRSVPLHPQLLRHRRRRRRLQAALMERQQVPALGLVPAAPVPAVAQAALVGTLRMVRSSDNTAVHS